MINRVSTRYVAMLGLLPLLYVQPGLAKRSYQEWQPGWQSAVFNQVGTCVKITEERGKRCNKPNSLSFAVHNQCSSPIRLLSCFEKPGGKLSCSLNSNLRPGGKDVGAYTCTPTGRWRLAICDPRDKQPGCHFNQRPMSDEEKCQLAAREYEQALRPNRCKQSGVCADRSTCVGGYCLRIGTQGKAAPYLRSKLEGKLSEKFVKKPAIKALEKALVRVGVSKVTVAKMARLGSVIGTVADNAMGELGSSHAAYQNSRRRLVNDMKILGTAIDGYLLDQWRKDRGLKPLKHSGYWEKTIAAHQSRLKESARKLELGAQIATTERSGRRGCPALFRVEYRFLRSQASKLASLKLTTP